MKISVITVVYNNKTYIEEAISSVLEQTYDDIEYIVVDGKSNDGTWEIIQSIDNRTKEQKHRITKAISEKDAGLYDAINKGIRMATGDYIGFVHSGDFFYSCDVIEKVARRIEETQCDIFYGDGIYVDTDDVNEDIRNWIGGSYSKRKMRFGWLPLHPTVYIKRELYERYGLYDTSYKIAGDTDLLIRFMYLQDVKVAYLHQYIIKMRMGGMSTSKSLTKYKWGEDSRVRKQYNLPFYFLPCKVVRKIPQFLTTKGGCKYIFKKLMKIVKHN